MIEQREKPELAQKLYDARKTRSWSRTYLAEQIINKVANLREPGSALPKAESVVRRIKDFESGKCKPGMRYRTLLCLALELSEAELFGDDPPDPRGPEGIGALITRHRRRLCLTQSDLSARLSDMQPGVIQVAQVSRWEREQQIPDVHCRNGLARVFALPSEEIDHAVKVTQACKDSPWHNASDIPPASPSEVAAMVKVSAQDSARLGELVDSTPFGSFTIDDVVSQLKALADAYPYTSPVDSLYTASMLRDRAFFLARRSHRVEYTRDLYLATAWICAILANASFDLGAVREACMHARIAEHIGEDLGHNGVRVWTRGLQALIAFWDDRLDDALTFAESAMDLRVETGTALVRARALYARSLSMMGRLREVNAAIGQTDEARAGVMISDSPLDDPGGMAEFPVAKQLYWLASTLFSLGSPQRLHDAERAAEGSIQLYRQVPPKWRRVGELCHAQLDLASTRWELGHPEGAEQQVADVVEILSNRYVESVARRVRRLGSRIRTRAGDARIAGPVLAQIAQADLVSPPMGPTRGELLPVGHRVPTDARGAQT